MKSSFTNLMGEISRCQVCAERFSHKPRPVLSINFDSKIALIGQAPGIKVHQSGKPWDDKSGERLRDWLGVDEDTFYNPQNFAILPMGFCYPGKGKSGDLPPSPECAPLWHPQILDRLQDLKLTLLVGQYAQGYYLAQRKKKTLTETVKNFRSYLPEFIVLPHPSPRNNIWLRKNSWFENENLPVLQEIIRSIVLHAD